MTCFDEPELAEVMNDAVTQAVMAADHVDRGALEDMLETLARTLPPRELEPCDCG